MERAEHNYALQCKCRPPMEFNGSCVHMSDDRNWLSMSNKNHLFCPLPPGRFPFVTLVSFMINNAHVLKMKTFFLPMMSLHSLSINMFIIKIFCPCLLLASSRFSTLIPLLWAVTNISKVKIIFSSCRSPLPSGFHLQFLEIFWRQIWLLPDASLKLTATPLSWC